MIEVRVNYKVEKGARTTRYFYTKVLVIGHANNGSMDSIKCCAGVTAILGGFKKCVVGSFDNAILEKGLFEYTTYTTKFYQISDTQIQLDCVINQLYEIYRCYPHLFKKFEFIEERWKNYGEN